VEVVRAVSFACVFVPWFAVAAEERCDPSLRERAVAVVTVPERAAPPPRRHGDRAKLRRGGVVARVIEASAAAREAGIRPGMTETEARARCPSLLTRPWSADRLHAARQAMLDAALALSPRVEDAGAGIVHVDIVGLAWLVGDGEAVARRLLRETRAVGLHASVGVADTRTAARVAARMGPRTVVIPPGAERAALASVDLRVLDLPAQLMETLASWGARTLGDLARLPRDGVVARLGAEGLAAHEAAVGLDTTPFRPYLPPPFWEEAQALDWEVETLEALACVIERVLERLVARLGVARVLAGELDVQLDLASGERHARTLPLTHPLGEVAPMLTLVILDLEAHPPRASVTRVAVSASPVRPQAVQPRLGSPLSPSVRDLAAVLARLAAIAGVDAVGSPQRLDTHRPDAFTLAPFAPPALAERQDDGEDIPAGNLDEGTAPLALRRLRPPRRALVTMEGEAEGVRPARVCMEPEMREERVVACAGPWRRSGTWWDANGWAYDEWDAALADGTLCRLRHDRLTDQWSLEGVYD
jgi:protein ImuB